MNWPAPSIRLLKKSVLDLKLVPLFAAEWQEKLPGTIRYEDYEKAGGPKSNVIDEARRIRYEKAVDLSPGRSLSEWALKARVEMPARSLVRRIERAGGMTVASNAFGKMLKGVIWTDDPKIPFKYFTPLSREDYDVEALDQESFARPRSMTASARWEWLLMRQAWGKLDEGWTVERLQRAGRRWMIGEMATVGLVAVSAAWVGLLHPVGITASFPAAAGVLSVAYGIFGHVPFRLLQRWKDPATSLKGIWVPPVLFTLYGATAWAAGALHKPVFLIALIAFWIWHARFDRNPFFATPVSRSRVRAGRFFERVSA